MALLGQFLRIPRNFEIFHDGFYDQVWGMMLPFKLFKDFSYWSEIWLDDAQ